METELVERIGRLETKVDLLKESRDKELASLKEYIEERFNELSSDVQALCTTVNNENAHTRERLNYLEKELFKESGRREFINRYVTPILIGLFSTIGTLLIQEVIKWIL